jgi:hypothetical protein
MMMPVTSMPVMAVIVVGVTVPAIIVMFVAVGVMLMRVTAMRVMVMLVVISPGIRGMPVRLLAVMVGIAVRVRLSAGEFAGRGAQILVSVGGGAAIVGAIVLFHLSSSARVGTPKASPLPQPVSCPRS